MTVATTRQAKLIYEKNASETRRADAKDDETHSPEGLAAPVQKGESNKRDK